MPGFYYYYRFIGNKFRALCIMDTDVKYTFYENMQKINTAPADGRSRIVVRKQGKSFYFELF
jgi:hypothetical protein